jgi:hypothetical protein
MPPRVLGSIATWPVEGRWPTKQSLRIPQLLEAATIWKISETAPGITLAWSSVTTSNLAGVGLWLDKESTGVLNIETNVVSSVIDLSVLADNVMASDAGGLGRRLSVYRLPEQDWNRRVTLEHWVTHRGSADLPVYIRVTQADGHQAWTSPIYLIA